MTVSFNRILAIPLQDLCVFVHVCVRACKRELFFKFIFSLLILT